MKLSRHLITLLRVIGRRLQTRAACTLTTCTLTGVEPEWLAMCEKRRAALPADAADDEVDFLPLAWAL